jgi:WhiB family redox-sensing transcriptional regulator
MTMSRELPKGLKAPETTFDTDEWRLKALCRGSDPEQFFYPDKQPWKISAKQAERVIDEQCLYCPVMTQCGEYAIKSLQYYGIWGGMTERELRQKVDERIVELAQEQKAAL